MAARVLFGLLVLGMMIFSLVGTQPGLVGNLNQRVVDSGVVLRVQGADVPQKLEPWELGADAAARARALTASGEPILPNSTLGGYAPNYAGLVGYAWNLPHTPALDDLNQWAAELRMNYAAEIPYVALQSGDILLNRRAGAFGHAVVFDHWQDPQLARLPDVSDRVTVTRFFENGLRFVASEVDSSTVPSRAVTRTFTLRIRDGAYTIPELDGRLQGPYFAMRSNRIPGYVATVSGVRAASQVQAGRAVAARMVLVNRGGQAVTLNHLTAIAYGPDALQQGVAAAAFLYPQLGSVTLQPGQLYEYKQSAVFNRAGSYVLMPRFEVNGQLYLPLEPTYISILG